MSDKDFIERLEEIISALKDGNREQAESDFADLYDEINDEYDNWDDDEEESEEEEWDDEEDTSDEYEEEEEDED